MKSLRPLFGAYLSGAMAIALAVHAVFGRGDYFISTYAIVLVTGAITAWSILLRNLPEAGVPLRVVAIIIAGCFVFGIAGGRLAHLAEVALSAGSSQAVADAQAVRQAGLGIFGAFLADALFLVLLFRSHPELSLARTLDAGASAVAVNVAFARAGCLLAGCCFGAPTGSWLGIAASSFDAATPAGARYGATDVHLWPTQPVEALVALALAVACQLLWRSRAARQWRDGTIIAIAALCYGSARAMLETVRADSPRVLGGVLSLWQAFAIALALAAAAWLFVSRTPVQRRGAL
jgi:phosphatidylglycerol:prolipoprotein diacylglycerol transferase